MIASSTARSRSAGSTAAGIRCERGDRSCSRARAFPSRPLSGTARRIASCLISAHHLRAPSRRVAPSTSRSSGRLHHERASRADPSLQAVVMSWKSSINDIRQKPAIEPQRAAIATRGLKPCEARVLPANTASLCSAEKRSPPPEAEATTGHARDTVPGARYVRHRGGRGGPRSRSPRRGLNTSSRYREARPPAYTSHVRLGPGVGGTHAR